MFPSLFSSRKMKTISNQTITNQVNKNYINEMIPRSKKGREERRRENGMGSGTSNQPVVLRIVNTGGGGRAKRKLIKKTAEEDGDEEEVQSGQDSFEPFDEQRNRAGQSTRSRKFTNPLSREKKGRF